MWSIGIYTGDAPDRLAPAAGIDNPVLSARDVTDVPAEFVADPFMVWSGGQWHMFFEVLNSATRNGEIGHATSPDGLRWSYQGIVLREPFHLSYPHVFEWKGAFFMTPETLGPGEVRLYRADPFPHRWSLVRWLLPLRAADPTVCRHDGLWWMFLCPRPNQHDTLELYVAPELGGHWTRHPRSPIVCDDGRRSRPAGRLLLRDGTITRFAQDCEPRYGTQVRAFEITRLTPEEYAEEERGIVLAPSGAGWNGMRMHHVDAQPWPQGPQGGWIACVDGFRL
jgi:hypothetical protein